MTRPKVQNSEAKKFNIEKNRIVKDGGKRIKKQNLNKINFAGHPLSRSYRAKWPRSGLFWARSVRGLAPHFFYYTNKACTWEWNVNYLK